MVFGEKLRSIRLSQNISQDELSKLTGISSRSICAYETSRVVPKTEKIVKIAKALNMPVDVLLQSISESSPEEEVARAGLLRGREVAVFLDEIGVGQQPQRAQTEKNINSIVSYFSDEAVPQAEKDRIFLFIMEQYLKAKQGELHPKKHRARGFGEK